MSNKYKINIDPKYKCTLDDLNSILIAGAFSSDDNKLEFIKTSTKLSINAAAALYLLFVKDNQLKNDEKSLNLSSIWLEHSTRSLFYRLIEHYKEVTRLDNNASNYNYLLNFELVILELQYLFTYYLRYCFDLSPTLLYLLNKVLENNLNDVETDINIKEINIDQLVYLLEYPKNIDLIRIINLFNVLDVFEIKPIKDDLNYHFINDLDNHFINVKDIEHLYTYFPNNH